MYWYNSSEQFFRQVSDLQRMTYENWVSTLPSMQSFSTSNYRDNFNKALSFQETLLSNSLELQAQLTRVYVDNQKQFWESYFKVLRNLW